MSKYLFFLFVCLSVNGQNVIVNAKLQNVKFGGTNVVSGGGGGGGIYTFLDSTSTASSGNNTAVTVSKNTTGAKLITISLGFYAASSIDLHDSMGNTYTMRTDNVDITAGIYHNQIYDCINPVTDSAMTWTVQVYTGTGYPTIHVQYFSYSGTTPAFDKKADYSGNGGVATSTPTLTSVTPSGNDELAISAISTDHSANSVDQGFQNLLNDGNSGVDESAAYLIQSGTANPVSPTFTLSGSTTVVSGSTVLYQ